MFGVFDQSGNILHGPGIADGIYFRDNPGICPPST